MNNYYYYRYYFIVTIDQINLSVAINANNPSSAYSKAKRKYPYAERIHLVRTTR